MMRMAFPLDFEGAAAFDDPSVRLLILCIGGFIGAIIVTDIVRKARALKRELAESDPDNPYPP